MEKILLPQKELVEMEALQVSQYQLMTHMSQATRLQTH